MIVRQRIFRVSLFLGFRRGFFQSCGFNGFASFAVARSLLSHGFAVLRVSFACWFHGFACFVVARFLLSHGFAVLRFFIGVLVSWFRLFCRCAVSLVSPFCHIAFSFACFFFCTRGSIFSIVGARVNVRVRQRLFESLVRQEIGFFDTTKTGDLTSRLAADCTKVGDQVTLNVNVFLR